MGNIYISKIRVNQTGYSSSLPVLAAFLLPGPVYVKNAKGKVIKTVDIPAPSFDEASGDDVFLADLGILPEGVYSLHCGSDSRLIFVSKDPCEEVTGALIRGLYYQRCGCELKEKHAGRFIHPACHTAPASVWEDKSVKKFVPGGWHDAGDYGKYVGPGAVTVAHLLYTYELFSEGCSIELNIPETGNGVPDILNEARYELEWILKMQREDGAFYHKLTKAKFAPFIMPQDDLEPEYLMPVSHCATAAACACLALGYRVYKKFDDAFAYKMLSAAVSASKWLNDNPDFVPFDNPEGVHTGQYGDKNLGDELFWASCELFASTGDEKYKESAEKLFAEATHFTSYGWADVTGLGSICCLFDLKEKAGEILYSKLKERFIGECHKISEICERSGYDTALPADRYMWGSILPIMSNAMSLILYEKLTGDESYRKHALSQWNYALGLNALDTCFVTGFGECRVMNPHHRPSGSDGIEEPVPGLISGGPNKLYNYPQTREKLGDAPAAKYFLDELPSADTNEVAIYWNSPAIFVGAFFSSLSK